MMEELEATLQDFARMNDFFYGDKLKYWNSRQLCYLFWKGNQCIHWSYDTCPTEYNEPRKKLLCTNVQVKIKVSVYNSDNIFHLQNIAKV